MIGAIRSYEDAVICLARKLSTKYELRRALMMYDGR